MRTGGGSNAAEAATFAALASSLNFTHTPHRGCSILVVVLAWMRQLPGSPRSAGGHRPGHSWPRCCARLDSPSLLEGVHGATQRVVGASVPVSRSRHHLSNQLVRRNGTEAAVGSAQTGAAELPRCASLGHTLHALARAGDAPGVLEMLMHARLAGHLAHGTAAADALRACATMARTAPASAPDVRDVVAQLWADQPTNLSLLVIGAAAAAFSAVGAGDEAVAALCSIRPENVATASQGEMVGLLRACVSHGLVHHVPGDAAEALASRVRPSSLHATPAASDAVLFFATRDEARHAARLHSACDARGVALTQAASVAGAAAAATTLPWPRARPLLVAAASSPGVTFTHATLLARAVLPGPRTPHREAVDRVRLCCHVLAAALAPRAVAALVSSGGSSGAQWTPQHEAARPTWHLLPQRGAELPLPLLSSEARDAFQCTWDAAVTPNNNNNSSSSSSSSNSAALPTLPFPTGPSGTAVRHEGIPLGRAPAKGSRQTERAEQAEEASLLRACTALLRHARRRDQWRAAQDVVTLVEAAALPLPTPLRAEAVLACASPRLWRRAHALALPDSAAHPPPPSVTAALLAVAGRCGEPAADAGIALAGRLADDRRLPGPALAAYMRLLRHTGRAPLAVEAAAGAPLPPPVAAELLCAAVAASRARNAEPLAPLQDAWARVTAEAAAAGGRYLEVCTRPVPWSTHEQWPTASPTSSSSHTPPWLLASVLDEWLPQCACPRALADTVECALEGGGGRLPLSEAAAAAAVRTLLLSPAEDSTRLASRLLVACRAAAGAGSHERDPWPLRPDAPHALSCAHDLGSDALLRIAAHAATAGTPLPAAFAEEAVACAARRGSWPDVAAASRAAACCDATAQIVSVAAPPGRGHRPHRLHTVLLGPYRGPWHAVARVDEALASLPRVTVRRAARAVARDGLRVAVEVPLWMASGDAMALCRVQSDVAAALAQWPRTPHFTCSPVPIAAQNDPRRPMPAVQVAVVVPAVVAGQWLAALAKDKGEAAEKAPKSPVTTLSALLEQTP